MRLQVDHTTHYEYDRPVSFGDHALYLRPRESHTLRVESFSLESSLESLKLRWVCDCFNNVVAVANFGLVQAAELSFRCRIVCELGEGNPFDFILDPRATTFPFSYDERECSALQPYTGTGKVPGAARVLDWFYHAVETPYASDIIGFLLTINSAICRDIGYAARDDEGVQTPDETLDLRTGSCRDMAVLFIAICRQLGLAARFVSGYLYVPTNPDGSGTLAKNRAAGSMHAWAEIYLPGAGWKAFDPTNGVLADHLFLPAAVASRPEWINPIQGKYFHQERVASHLDVELKIEEIA